VFRARTAVVALSALLVAIAHAPPPRSRPGAEGAPVAAIHLGGLRARLRRRGEA
jgi:hypothetical protein